MQAFGLRRKSPIISVTCKPHLAIVFFGKWVRFETQSRLRRKTIGVNLGHAPRELSKAEHPRRLARELVGKADRLIEEADALLAEADRLDKAAEKKSSEDFSQAPAQIVKEATKD